MNDDQRRDDELLEQVNRLLERNKPSREPVINRLAAAVPQADPAFQDSLEDLLLARLESENASKENNTMQFAVMKRPARTFSPSVWTWLAAVLAMIVLGGGLLLSAASQPPRVYLSSPTLAATPQATVEPVYTIVVAAQRIPAYSIITEDMVGVISLSANDLAKVRQSQPDREFFSDPAAVIGQKAATDIFWFEPLEPMLLGNRFNPCNPPTSQCPQIPEGYFTVGLTTTPSTLQGLTVGNRVDVLALADGQLHEIVENALLADIQPNLVTFAVPSWQQSVLIWLYQSGESYALRLHTGASPAAPDSAMTNYTFTAPDPIPDNFQFEVIVGLSASKGYLLTDLPYSIDNIPFTESGDTLQFWFKNLEVVSVENGTTVTIRLPKGDAANFDFLLKLSPQLSFIPNEYATPQS